MASRAALRLPHCMPAIEAGKNDARRRANGAAESAKRNERSRQAGRCRRRSSAGGALEVARSRARCCSTASRRGRYATDASIYQIEPIGVVIPKTDADVAGRAPDRARGRRAAAAARRRHVAVGPDGRACAGHRLHEAPQPHHRDRLRRRAPAWVEPGIVLDELNRQLKAIGAVVSGRCLDRRAAPRSAA